LLTRPHPAALRNGACRRSRLTGRAYDQRDLEESRDTSRGCPRPAGHFIRGA
jgi:hypothetical protein